MWRSVDRKQRIVQTVWPWTVVEDRKDETVLFIPVGTVGKRRTGERGGPGNRFIVQWDGGPADVTWERTNVVRFYRSGDPYSLWLAFDALTWELAWRYINLEDPWLRTAIGSGNEKTPPGVPAGPNATGPLSNRMIRRGRVKSF